MNADGFKRPDTAAIRPMIFLYFFDILQQIPV